MENIHIPNVVWQEFAQNRRIDSKKLFGWCIEDTMVKIANHEEFLVVYADNKTGNVLCNSLDIELHFTFPSEDFEPFEAQLLLDGYTSDIIIEHDSYISLNSPQLSKSREVYSLIILDKKTNGGMFLAIIPIRPN